MSLPAVPSESIESSLGYKYTEVFNLAKTDMDFFAGLALPEVYKYPFPDLYLQLWYMWNQYQKREPHIYQRNGLICHDTSRTENDFAFYGGAGYGQNPGIDFGKRLS